MHHLKNSHPKRYAYCNHNTAICKESVVTQSDALLLHKFQMMLEKGERLAPPPGCPRGVYSLMIDCW